VSPRGPSAADNAELRRGRFSRIGTVEGYLSLPLLIVGVLAPALIPPVPEPYGVAVGIALWAIAWLLSLSGTRHGRGYGRLAAGLSLTLLSMHAICLIVLILGGAILIHHP
jgi:hypothetical protein